MSTIKPGKGDGGTPPGSTGNDVRGFPIHGKSALNRQSNWPTPSQAARGTHRSAQAAVRNHVKAGTLASEAGRQSVQSVVQASSNLRDARASAVVVRTSAKANPSLAMPRASVQPKPGLALTPGPVPASLNPPLPEKPLVSMKATMAARVVDSMNGVSKAMADRAAMHLADLHAQAKTGSLKAIDIHQQVERIGRGTTKNDLFAAARSAGITHAATTHQGLLEHLKSSVYKANESGRQANFPAI